ncbi:contact-dependent growth inhibition system immunity protein [Paraburkholderia caballeronis]|uniref:contact-dependent growth inhibition system immunity protein n=1 Tax=Paraburkholderia caballeronis TaxID=416943 RepID=UPI001064F899|nr:contact-dependent growth inhibition system immunity protein [Paraburkholderia caballeronis]TDV08335.1 hypothetical protein C7408_117102 [Paraburkholderia caballeronis]TDV12027.1 hypothetical protein C7406_118102 [Paraburkholderia caballeronis]TDV22648.1 hypothetical protein C7404_117102 [Paraburkholderia caballeronis]TDV35186.1 hypothetical protein C7405_106218 [Paraburkholderia caballeronis]
MPSDRYPGMRTFFGGYLNQDYELAGDTIPEIVACYKGDSPRECHFEMVHEIEAFMAEHPQDLDVAFETDYGSSFDPKLWGYTTASFLEELKGLLAG